MRPVQNAGGHVGLTCRAYPVGTSTALSAGEVVKLSAGLVVAAAANETGPILGIAAENHPGSADALNVRANGAEILVYDNPDLPKHRILHIIQEQSLIIIAGNVIQPSVRNN